MGLLSKVALLLLKRTKGPTNNKEKLTAGTSVSLEEDISYGDDETGRSSKATIVTTGNSENDARILAAGKQFFESLANGNAEGAVRACVTGCEVAFKDQEFGLECCLEESSKIWRAFPDFNQTCPNGFQLEKDAKGVVHFVTRGCVPNGHHTGAPYGFGPYEPVPVTNKYVENAPETLRMYVNEDGKVYKVLIDAEGVVTGPAGIYQQIGGFLSF